MQKYTKCKKVLVGNKMRTLYKTSNSNKLYIKHKKKMMSYKNYKKMKSLKTKSKKVGGVNDEHRFVTILREIYHSDQGNLLVNSIEGLSIDSQSASRKRKLSIMTPDHNTYLRAQTFLINHPTFNSRQVVERIIRTHLGENAVHHFRYFLHNLPE
jgi:predicted RND superfamily exporter protein